MMIPKHCSNPRCHKPYVSADGTDLYREVLVKLSTEMAIRVISVCRECRKDYSKQMAQEILNDVLPVEIGQISESATMSNKNKLEKIQTLTNYTIEAVGIDTDELNKKLYG